MEWTIQTIKSECERLSNIVGDTFICPIKINARLSRALGRCMLTLVNDKLYVERLEFSKSFIETATDESILAVIDHEWRHYYATKSTHKDHKHDKYFKEICAKIGCTNDGRSFSPSYKGEEPASQYKYDVYCPDCKEIIRHYMRKGKNLKEIEYCRCKKCGCSSLEIIQNW